MLEIGSRYKTGYLFLSLSASLCCSSYKLLCCWRHTRRILNTIESNSSNSFTPSFLFFIYNCRQQITLVVWSLYRTDRTRRHILPRVMSWAKLSWAAPFNGQRSVPWAASASASALPPGWFVCKARGSGSGSLLASVSRDWHWRQENELCRIITTKNVTPIDRGERGLGTAGQLSNRLTGSSWLSDCIPPRPLSLPPLSTPLPLRTIYRCCFCYTLAASGSGRAV